MGKAVKNWEKVLFFWENCIWIGILKLSLLRTGYFSWAANLLTISPKIWHVNKRDFFRLNWLDNDQSKLSKCCDADFNSTWEGYPCCLLKGPPKRDLLDIYLTTFSESVISKLQNLWGSPFFPKCSKSNLDFKNAAKNWEKVFSFWDNCIRIGIVILSLLRRGYFSSRAKVLTGSPKIWHVNKRDFLRLTRYESDQWIWSRCYDADSKSSWSHLPCSLWKCPLNLGFLDIYLTTFSESVISEIQNLLGSYFVSKYLKFNLDFKNVAKNWEKVVFFWINCIVIGIVKLSLLRRGYFSPRAKVVTSSPKIWHVNKTDYF